MARAPGDCVSFVWCSDCFFGYLPHFPVHLRSILIMLAHFLFVIFLFILSLPLQAIIALLVALTGGFPIFFVQRRTGKNGIPFVMYKFRSMRVGAQKNQKKYISMNESDGPVFKIHDDPRFTALGKFLAHTGLDELPQVYNVLTGDMALFGPRPLPIAEAKKLKPWQQARHAIKPGILSPAIVAGKYHEDFDAWMKSDIAYVKNKNFFHDVRLAVLTVKFLLRLILDEISHRF